MPTPRLLALPHRDAHRERAAVLAATHLADPHFDNPTFESEWASFLAGPPRTARLIGPFGSGRSHQARRLLALSPTNLRLIDGDHIEGGEGGHVLLVAESNPAGLATRPDTGAVPDRADQNPVDQNPVEHPLPTWDLHLSPWDAARAEALLRHLAHQLAEPKVGAWLDRWPGGFEAIYAMSPAGGPREVHQILRALLAGSVARSPELVWFERLHQENGRVLAQLDALAEHPRAVLSALRGARALTAGQIAERTGIDTNTLSAQLHRLRAAGTLARTPGPRGRSPHHMSDTVASLALALSQGAEPELVDLFRLHWLVRVSPPTNRPGELAPTRRRLLALTRPPSLTPPVPAALALLGRPDALAASLPKPARVRALRTIAETVRDMPGPWPAGWDARAVWEAIGGSWLPLQRKEELVRELSIQDPHARAHTLSALGSATRLLNLLFGEEAVRAMATALRAGDLAHPADLAAAGAAATRLSAPSLARTIGLAAAAAWPEPAALRGLYENLVAEDAGPGPWLIWVATAVHPSLLELRREGARRAWARADGESWFPTAFVALALPAEAPLDGAESALALALEREPRDPSAWTLLGELRWRQGQTQAAEAAFQRALELFSDQPLGGRGNESLQKSQQITHALFGRSSETEPLARALAWPLAWPSARLALVCAADPNRRDETRRHARRALGLVPEAVGPRLILAGLDPEEAPRWLEPLEPMPEARFVSLAVPPDDAPSPPEALIAGLLHLARRRAEDDHLQALLPHIRPGQPISASNHPWARLSRALEPIPDREAANSLCRERPEDALIWVLQAQVLDQSGEDPESAWRRAAALDPDEALALAGLAECIGRRRHEGAAGAADRAEIVALHTRLAALGASGPLGRLETARRAAERGLSRVVAEEALSVLTDELHPVAVRAGALALIRGLLATSEGRTCLIARLNEIDQAHSLLATIAHLGQEGRDPEELGPLREAIARRLLAPQA